MSFLFFLSLLYGKRAGVFIEKETVIRLKMRTLVLLIAILWIGVSGSYAIDVEAGKKIKNVFYFSFSGEGYSHRHTDDTAEWERLAAYYSSRSDLSVTGNYYFLIESCIYINVYSPDPAQLNQAAFQGSLVRSRLRSHLRVPSEKIAFYINRSGNLRNRVKVTLVSRPLPSGANTDIFYSLGNSREDLLYALSRYNEIPYYDLAYYEEVAKRSVQPERLASARQPEQVEPTEPVQQTEPVQESTPVQQQCLHMPHRRPVAAPFNLAVKTNLIPWLGVVSSWDLSGKQSSGYSSGALMYNGALEYHFAGRYSTEASFLYSYTSFDGREDNLWGIFRVSLEPRCWLVSDGTFRGLNAGLRLTYGDFDMQNNNAQKQGKTGRFYSVAMTVGYTQPLFRYCLLEGRLWGGYRNVYDGKEYRVDDGDHKNYLEKGFAQGQWMVGLELSLGFRIGFR